MPIEVTFHACSIHEKFCESIIRLLNILAQGLLNPKLNHSILCQKKQNLVPRSRQQKQQKSPSQKKTTTPAVKKVKKPAVKEATATAAPAKKRTSTATPRKNEKITLEQQPSSEVSMSRDVVEVAAYLNWCGRRNQGLPDDAFADWISAELLTGLAN